MRPTSQNENPEAWIVKRGISTAACDDPIGNCDSRRRNKMENHPITCCSATGDLGHWRQRHWNTAECHGVWTASDIWDMHQSITAEGRCLSGTWYDAERVCAENGGRLCTKNEVEAGCAEATGCEFDTLLIWSQTESSIN